MATPHEVAERALRRYLDMTEPEWDARWPAYWRAIATSELPEAVQLQRMYRELVRAVEEDRQLRSRAA
jgi:hypothetical protein